jgi:hypothetical protein
MPVIGWQQLKDHALSDKKGLSMTGLFFAPEFSVQGFQTKV